MKIEKKMLGEAIKVLGKIISISNTDLALRSVRFVGDGDSARAIGSDGENTVILNVESEGVEEVDFCVELKDLRDLLRGCKNEFIEFEGEKFEGAYNFAVPDNAFELAISDDFVEALKLVAPIVDRDSSRPMLRGINLSCNGVVATDGKQILNVPINWGLQHEFTIPFPLALLTAKIEGCGVLNFWHDNEDFKFRIKVGSFEWFGIALKGMFPDWTKAIPNAQSLDYSVEFKKRDELITFLKCVPESPLNAIEINITSQSVKIIPHDFTHLEYNADAIFEGVQPREVLALNRQILIQMLQFGFNKFQAHSDGRIPVVASGNKGKYIVLPIRISSKITKEEVKVNTEETKVVTNPLDELNSNVEEFRNRLKILLEESTALIRRVKEISIQQKQKEREFVQARKAIERIKMAI